MNNITEKSDKHLAILDYFLKFETEYGTSKINKVAFQKLLRRVELAGNNFVNRFDMNNLNQNMVGIAFEAEKNIIKRSKLIAKLERDYIIRLVRPVSSNAPELNYLEFFKNKITTKNFLLAGEEIECDITFKCAGIINRDIAIKKYVTSVIKQGKKNRGK